MHYSSDDPCISHTRLLVIKTLVDVIKRVVLGEVIKVPHATTPVQRRACRFKLSLHPTCPSQVSGQSCQHIAQTLLLKRQSFSRNAALTISRQRQPPKFGVFKARYVPPRYGVIRPSNDGDAQA